MKEVRVSEELIEVANQLREDTEAKNKFYLISESCPVALALQRAFNNSNITCGLQFASGMKLPCFVTEAIILWDELMAMEPLTFEVDEREMNLSLMSKK